MPVCVYVCTYTYVCVCVYACVCVCVLVLYKCEFKHSVSYQQEENLCCIYVQNTAVAQSLKCCATNRKVTGSIPDGVIGIFH